MDGLWFDSGGVLTDNVVWWLARRNKPLRRPPDLYDRGQRMTNAAIT